MEWVTEAVRGLSDLPFPLLLAVAGVLAFAESGLGVGSVVPGETAVVILGAAAADPVRYPVMLVVVALGVTAGDHVGYWLGRSNGERMRETRAVRRLGVRHWDRATGALRRYGAAAVFVTRLVPVVRTLTPAAAGVANVPYRRFLVASLAGSLLWSAVFVSLGAFAGASASRLEQLLGWGAWIVFGLAAALIIAVLVVRRARSRSGGRRAAASAAPGDKPDEPPNAKPDEVRGEVRGEVPDGPSGVRDGPANAQPGEVRGETAGGGFDVEFDDASCPDRAPA
ncbi:DedA family protein [Actinomadura algeriensis]|uniref:Membrane protein DedA with SNARE-associated domain n=1 Tax=Actinomadura algeriensis TaxID=1679523 RepID=A0ABR9JJP4_9ACTN|nr:DedA family protein [Actinomadura algeriensis]MBE1530783.1 membrane protein DedA with SNARE-associated domain [Actinomadura algeriensis]